MSRLLEALRRIEARADLATQAASCAGQEASLQPSGPPVVEWPAPEPLTWPAALDLPTENHGLWPPTTPRGWGAEDDISPPADEPPESDPASQQQAGHSLGTQASWEYTPGVPESIPELEAATTSVPDMVEAPQGLPDRDPDAPELSGQALETNSSVVVAEVQTQAAEASDQGRFQVIVPQDEPTNHESPATVRLPTFGRPQAEQSLEHDHAPVFGHRRTSLVPFLSPEERPYREACEAILASLPPRGASLVLAWTDDDLDYCRLTCRIAESLAERLDDPVLLIDGGRQQRLTAALQVKSGGSLNQALAGFASWREQIVQTSTAGLCMLPSAPGDFDGDGIAVARLIEGCKQCFAIVLICGSAASGMPANVLAACDAAVLLVQQGHTPVSMAASAIERLRSGGTDVLGCLVTGVGGPAT